MNAVHDLPRKKLFLADVFEHVGRGRQLKELDIERTSYTKYTSKYSFAGTLFFEMWLRRMPPKVCLGSGRRETWRRRMHEAVAALPCVVTQRYFVSAKWIRNFAP